jgi:hypothetical protein
MNVFEDLIEALKEDNLLESTVMDVPQRAGEPISPVQGGMPAESLMSTSFALTGEEAEIDEGELDTDPVLIEKPVSPREFFRKRAMDEVSSLQMVEHILSGVEREHMKMVPVPFDDIKVKQALHRFLQVSGNSSKEESSSAEFDLMHQTQGWFSALSDRDRNISVGNIRRFVENSRPALSSQAMIALARFYRNSPYTENSRSKFDFVMTRLFSREADDDRRRLLFPRNEMVGHIKTLYENWSSIEAYTPAEDSAEINAAVSQFKQFTAEADDAGSLDGLLGTKLFDRIAVFKDEIGELFFAREVTAAAIDCNNRVGNRFVELVAASHRSEVSGLGERYGESLEQLVSNTTGRTFLLSEMASGDGSVSPDETGERDRPESVSSPTGAAAVTRQNGNRFAFLAVNKWLLAATIIITTLSLSAYFWADQAAADSAAPKTAAEINIASTGLDQHLEKAKSSNETFYGVTATSWDSLSDEEKTEFMSKVVDFASQRGLRKVNLLNYRGRTVAYSNDSRLEILPPA